MIAAQALKLSLAGNAALAVLCLVLMLRADAISADRDKHELATKIVANNLSTSNASLKECNQALADITADGASREDRLAQHAAKQLEEARAIKEQAEDLIRSGPTKDCRTSGSVIRNKNI